jgi:hypothetical protein
VCADALAPAPDAVSDRSIGAEDAVMMSSQYGARTVIEWRTAVGSAERGRQGTILESVMGRWKQAKEQKTQESYGMAQDIWRGMEVSNQSQRPRSHHRE